MEVNEKYTPIIGLEIHIELNTKSKMFCQCPADYFGADPNTHTCPVCLGMPGGLPVPNREAIERTMVFGKALNCNINNEFKFDRKHYFYPDLAKGYQISQYDEPIAVNGKVPILTKDGVKEFGITRVHLEEDTGKLSHVGDESRIDFNRAGVPLMEIVTEPEFRNGEDVKVFLEELQTLARYLGVAQADMEKGDMRLEPNISVQLTAKLPELPEYKVEVKNINSFRFVKKTIEYEIDRHIEILESGELPPQETRGYDNATGTTVSQRTKEDAEDYRYFPEPDIPPFEYSDEQLEKVYGDMPELPIEKAQRYMSDMDVKFDDAMLLSRTVEISEFFERLVGQIEDQGAEIDEIPQTVANHIINKKVSPDADVAKIVTEIVATSKPVETDTGRLGEVIKDVISNNENAVNDVTSGKNPNAIMFLVGQVMKEMKGQADAQLVREELEKKLK